MAVVLMCIMGLWVVIATKLHTHIMQKVKVKKFRQTISASLFVLLLMLPLTDEAIGGVYFWYLCYTEDLLEYDAEKLRGKTVIYTSLPNETINSIIPIELFSAQWLDFKTKEPLLTRRSMRAKGGWLSRYTLFPSGSSKPYLFENFCAPHDYSKLFETLNVTELDQ